MPLPVTPAAVPPATRCGIDSIAAARPQFGDRSRIITVFPQYASIIGWNGLVMIFFGKSVGQLLVTIGTVHSASADMIVRVVTLLASVLVSLILMRGDTGLERVSHLLFFVIAGVFI